MCRSATVCAPHPAIASRAGELRAYGITSLGLFRGITPENCRCRFLLGPPSPTWCQRKKEGSADSCVGSSRGGPPDKPAVNAKRLRRIMGNHVVLLESHTAVYKDRADELAVLGASLPLVRYGARSQLAMSAVVNPHAIRLKPPLTDFKRTSECRPSSISPPTEYSVTTKSAARANCVPQ